MSKIKTNQCEICDPGNAEYCHEEGCCNPEMRGEYKRLTDADLAELADLAEELETIADVSDMENRGPMYAGQHIRSGLVKVSRESAEKLRNGAELIRKLNKEFAELAKAKAENRWISITERLPESGKHVLLCCVIRPSGRKYICDGYYANENTLSCNCDDDIAFIYSEDDDEYYLAEGYYEVIKNWGDYSSVAIGDFVTHWMMLPELPELPEEAEQALKNGGKNNE